MLIRLVERTGLSRRTVEGKDLGMDYLLVVQS